MAGNSNERSLNSFVDDEMVLERLRRRWDDVRTALKTMDDARKASIGPGTVVLGLGKDWSDIDCF